MQQKILLVEDDQDIRETLCTYLEEAGFLVDTAFDGVDGIEKYRLNAYDVVLLDLMLPRKNGIEVLTTIRKDSFVPIIIISAKESEFDKSVALELGADDYVTKPFSFIELAARVRSVIRRSTVYIETASVSRLLVYKDLAMDLETHSLTKSGVSLKITGTEFAILQLFLENKKKVFTKEDIYLAVWKEAYYGDENIVNVHMSRLREKIEKDSKHPEIIETLWGIGYRLKEAEESVYGQK